jgi:hypothetical protein
MNPFLIECSPAWKIISTYVFFKILLPFSDMIFDVYTGVKYFQQGHVKWGGATIFFVMVR